MLASIRSAPSLRGWPALRPLPGLRQLAGASRFMCCEPVASAMVNLVQLRNSRAHLGFQCLANLLECRAGNARQDRRCLAVGLARKALDPSQIDPWRRRCIEAEVALFRRIEKDRSLRRPIHRRKICPYAPRHGRWSCKPIRRHLFPLLLVAVNHYPGRPAQPIPLRNGRA